MISGHASGKCRILVVEDNPADVELLRWALAGAGLACELTVLDDGGKAMAFVRQQGMSGGPAAFELAVLDLNLPKNDGLEILEALRANPAFADLPVAILSSSSSPREQTKMAAFGILRYIAKPPDLDEYMKIGLVMKELLEEAHARGIPPRLNGFDDLPLPDA